MKNSFEEEILQAVVIADSFDEKFGPLSLDLPRCLMPLCNIPLIEYTLEALASAGMQEIFIVCSAHASLISHYIQSSKWANLYLPKISVITSLELSSVGDALRDLDTKQVLKSDFVLVFGDLVTNINLYNVLELHNRTKEQDKNCIMTMVLNPIPTNHRSRPNESNLLCIDSKTNACLYYSPLSYIQRKSFTKIPLENFKSCANVSIRTDLVDSNIYVCSLEVPALFTENFDYQDFKTDFVKGILESELLGKTIYCHVENDAYCMRVSSTRMYDAVSKDVMSRWAFPMSPDSPMFRKHELVGTTIYKGDTFLSRLADLQGHVTLGSGTRVGESLISNSVIGSDCVIGNGVVIENSYLWDHCVIEDNSKITSSIIATGVTVKSGISIERGCLIGANVVVQENQTEFSRVTVPEKLDYPPETSEIDRRCANFSVEYEDDEQDLIYQEFARDLAKTLDLNSDSENELEDSDEEISEEEQRLQLVHEINATFDRAIQELHDPEVAALELNTLKMAFNISFHDLRSVVLPNMMNRIEKTKLSSSIKQLFTKWDLLLKKLVHDEQDQLDCIVIIAEFCANQDAWYAKAFAMTLPQLYSQDVIEEGPILDWYSQSENNAQFALLRTTISKFIEWLQQSDEDSE